MNVNRKTDAVDWKKFFLIIFVIAALAYQWYQRENSLPDVADQASVNPSQKTETPPRINPTNNLPDHGDYLESIGGQNLKSPAGLIYSDGPRGEHRIEHVMRHADDITDRPVHGVFDGDRVSILRVLDEAYKKVLTNSSDVDIDDSDANTVYTIDMHRRIGYEGGERGRDRKNRELKRIRLVLSGERVITAFPYR